MDFDLKTVNQIGLATLSLASIYLVERENRWGYVLGLAGQPCWWYAAVTGQQWGMAVVNVFYTLIWSRGVYRRFFQKPSSPTA